MWGTSLDFLAALTALVPPPAKLAKTSMLTRVCDTHLYRKPTQRASQAAWECVFEVLSGVGMRFRSGLKGLKGFWACRMRGGASQEQGFVASLDLVHSQNGLLLVYSLFIDYLLPPLPKLPRMPDLCSPCALPKRLFTACLFVVY